MSAAYQGPDPFASASFQSLKTFVADRLEGDRADGGDDFERLEKELHERVMAFEAEVVAACLSRYDEDVPEVEVEGVVYRRKAKFPKEYCALAGHISVERMLYVPREGGKAVCPLELRVGMVEGYWTPLAARVAARAVAGSTPREAAGLFEEIGGMRPSASSIDRLPKALSEHWEENRKDFEDETRNRETIPAAAVSVAVSLDGVLVPIKPDDATKEDDQKPPEGAPAQESDAEDADKRASGPKGYREVGCGTVTLYDKDGERLQTVRYGRVPEFKKATLKSQLDAELRSILEGRPDLKVVGLSDGAQDHWDYLESLPERLNLDPDDVKLALDIFHNLQYVKEAMDASHGEGTSAAKAAFEECRIWLREEADGVERVLRALRHRRNNTKGKKRKTISKAIKYLAKRKGLCRYKQLLDASLPIGSGIVEAACKTLAAERLKRSGMRWGEEGCQGILTLRSLLQSQRWAVGWELLASQYKAYVVVPEPQSNAA